jgi:hypothetical protein
MAKFGPTRSHWWLRVRSNLNQRGGKVERHFFKANHEKSEKNRRREEGSAARFFDDTT